MEIDGVRCCCYSSGRFLIPSDNLALVLMLCKGRSTFFKHCFPSWVESSRLASGQVLCHIFWCIPSELTYFDLGSRFFDRDFDPSNSLLQIFCTPRTSPVRIFDQDCLSPPMMHLDVGEIGRTSHIHVPAVSVQSNAPSADLSCTGHAAAVSSQGSSTVGKNDCTGGFGNLMGHGSLAPLTWCGPPLGFLGRDSWIQRR